MQNFSLLVDKIIKEYDSKSAKLYVILIAGLSRSGKTTLSKKIGNYITDKKIENNYISLDNWIVDIDKRKANETVRERFEYSKIITSIKLLMDGKNTAAFVYNPESRKKTSNRKILKSLTQGIYIIEGVIALDIEYLRNIADFKIYVQTSYETRLERLYDFHKTAKGLSSVKTESILETRELDETPFIENTKKFADIVYDG